MQEKYWGLVGRNDALSCILTLPSLSLWCLSHPDPVVFFASPLPQSLLRVVCYMATAINAVQDLYQVRATMHAHFLFSVSVSVWVLVSVSISVGFLRISCM